MLRPYGGAFALIQVGEGAIAFTGAMFVGAKHWHDHSDY
jgi:hypothetical protein